MGRKKRRSKQFKDSSKVIDMEQARKERQERLERRRQARPPKPDPEETKTAETAAPSSARQSRRRVMMRRRKRLSKAFVVAVCAVLFALLSVSVGQIILLEHDLHQAKKQQEEYKEEKKQMEKDMQEINDLDYLEEQARDQMRLIMPGETLYIFPEDMSQ